MTEHERMIDAICKNPQVLAKALGLPFIWIRTKEYVINNETQEKADLIFQNKFNAYKIEPETICYVLELKSEQADHEVLGQLQKAVNVMKKVGEATNHWEDVRGIAIAKKYTLSARDLLNTGGYRTLLWSDEKEGFTLRETGEVKEQPKEPEIKRKAIKFFRKKGIVVQGETT